MLRLRSDSLQLNGVQYMRGLCRCRFAASPQLHSSQAEHTAHAVAAAVATSPLSCQTMSMHEPICWLHWLIVSEAEIIPCHAHAFGWVSCVWKRGGVAYTLCAATPTKMRLYVHTDLYGVNSTHGWLALYKWRYRLKTTRAMSKNYMECQSRPHRCTSDPITHFPRIFVLFFLFLPTFVLCSACMCVRLVPNLWKRNIFSIRLK